jgi:glycosyltransferase involved in cell wall biosynthesis
MSSPREIAPAEAPVTLALIANVPAVVAWRIGWPMVELSRRGYPVAWADFRSEDARRLLGTAEVVILPRLSWLPGDEAKALAFRDILHKHGTAIIYEIDDDLLSPAIVERIRAVDNDAAAGEEIEAHRQAWRFALRIADGVTCSTEPLAEVARGLTDKQVVVVPNAIDTARFRAAMGERDPTRPLTIGWAGGNRPDADAAACAEAWGRIARRYPDVRFLVGGHNLTALVEAVPADRVEYVARQPLSTYPGLYARMGVACCPLGDTAFNRSKSPIKAYEAAIAGAAVVASPTVYGDLIEDGHTGLLADTADGWEAALRLLLERPLSRRTLAANLAAVVERDHSLAVNAHRWPDAWAAILADFRARQDAEAACTRDPIAV